MAGRDDTSSELEPSGDAWPPDSEDFEETLVEGPDEGRGQRTGWRELDNICVTVSHLSHAEGLHPNTLEISAADHGAGPAPDDPRASDDSADNDAEEEPSTANAVAAEITETMTREGRTVMTPAELRRSTSVPAKQKQRPFPTFVHGTVFGLYTSSQAKGEPQVGDLSDLGTAECERARDLLMVPRATPVGIGSRVHYQQFLPFAAGGPSVYEYLVKTLQPAPRPSNHIFYQQPSGSQVPEPLRRLEAHQQFSAAHNWAKPAGLSMQVYREVMTWLQDEADRGRPVDLCVLQETAWRDDQEFSTCHQAPVDFLLVYQHAWNPQRADLRGANKTEALLKQRRAIWAKVNLLVPRPLTQIKARTFLPPNADQTKLGTQIDYVIAKGHTIDTVAKQATAFDAPFVPASGCRHRPIKVGPALKQPGFLGSLMRHTRQAQSEQADTQPIDELLLAGDGSSCGMHKDIFRPMRRNFAQIAEYFQLLYDGIPLQHTPTLTEDLNITTEEILHAMARLQPNKAVPSVSAPAALWKQLSQVTVPTLRAQFAQVFRKGTQTVPETWSVSELILLPKPNKSLRTPAHLRPICLLPLQAKLTASILASRLLPFVNEYLKDQPQFAYVPHRTLAQALERVTSHCHTVRNLLQRNTLNIHNRRQGHAQLSLCGGCQLSLDISCAYDHVPRQALQMALREALVPENLVQAVLMIHEEAKLKVAHCGHEKLIPLRRGLRQGCSLSPMLWSLYTGWLFRKMYHPEVLPITKHVTSYADDKHFAWVISNGRDLEKAYAAMKHILASLQELGLSISTEKTVILLELKGPQAAKAVTRYTVKTKEGRCMRFNIAAKEVNIKIVAKHVYLGAVIGYKSFEHDTFLHRSRLAKSTFTRLGTVLKNRSVPAHLRFQLWRGCVWPTWLHGLDSVGLNVRDRQTLHTQLIVQARTIANSFSMITRESNLKFLQRHHLPDPVRRLQTAITLRSSYDPWLGPKLRPTEELLSWRRVVYQQLLDPEVCPWSQATPARNHRLHYLGDSTQPSFDCDVCGQSFSTQAALRSHMFRMHLDQQSKTERVDEVKQARNIPSMEHAKDGLPQCRHCLHSFTTWHAFFYHVQAQGCTGLRQFLKQAAEDHTLLPTLSEALIDNPTLLEAARNSTWQDLARLDCVKNKLQYCVECNHRSAKQQYVRRHMLAMHPERTDLIYQCIEDIKKSKVSISNPCNFCGQSYQRKDSRRPKMYDVFGSRMEVTIPLELREATQDLHMLRTLLPQPESQEIELLADPTSDADRQPKWPRSHPKGYGRHGGKGNRQGTQPTSTGSWSNEQAHQTARDSGKPPRRQRETSDKDLAKQLAEMKSSLGMLATLVLRQEIQQNVSKQDTSFVLFLDTRGPHNIATSLYKMGETWVNTKREHPERLKAPLRVILFQHLIEVVLHKFKAMTDSPSSRSTAQNLGLLMGDGINVPALKWDPETRQHVQDTMVEPIATTTIKEALEELLVLCTKTLVIARFHGMRKLSEEYAAPTLGMFLEIGMRTPEAHAAWNHLHRLQQSASWKAAGVFLRHERLHMSALAKKALLFLSSKENRSPNIFGESHSAFLQGLIRQHDVAEFLQFLCGKTLTHHPCIEISWQARTQVGNGPSAVLDRGSSAPLLLPSPGDTTEDCGLEVSVQSLVHRWHQQEQIHAMFAPAESIVLQLCRFDFEAGETRAVKRRYKVQPDSRISVPAFSDDMQRLHYSYRLSACIIHLGDAPDNGHYHNVFCSATNLNYYIGDDGVSARPISEGQLCLLGRDIYLLFYTAHKAD
ncbi:unnamed protein product [Symbiodinium sp. CCMP2456]|nr:unnamed protein product [Symbiodinium sp. CCMP2456]